MEIEDINRMSMAELTRFVSALATRMSGIASQPTAAEIDAFARLSVLERAEVLHSRAIRLHDEILKRHADYVQGLVKLGGLSAQLTASHAELASALSLYNTRCMLVEQAIVSITQTLEAMQNLLKRAWGARRPEEA